MKSKLKSKRYSLAEAFGEGLPEDQYITGYEPSDCPFVPRPDRHWRWDRRLLRDLIVWWEEGGSDAVHLFGPTGCGKSSAARNFCAALWIPMYERTVYQGLEFIELVSRVELSDGSTVTSYSHLPLAMGAEGYPGIFVVNEIDRADPGTVIGLNEVLEGQPLLVQSGGLDLVVPEPGFRIAATGNSALGGDMVGAYVSVRQQDMACADRYWMLSVSYPEPDVEEKILEAVAPHVPSQVRTAMIQVANDIRAAFMGISQSAEGLPITMSTRSLCRWARMSYYFRAAELASLKPVAYAFDRALLNRAHGMPEVRRALIEIARGRMGDVFAELK